MCAVLIMVSAIAGLALVILSIADPHAHPLELIAATMVLPGMAATAWTRHQDVKAWIAEGIDDEREKS